MTGEEDAPGGSVPTGSEHIFGLVIHMQLVRQRGFDLFIRTIFATDARGNAKGVVEVEL